MSETIAEMPFWSFQFDEGGTPIRPAEHNAAIAEMQTAALTDLFIFAHGWNNDRTTALDRYRHFFGDMGTLLANAAFPAKRSATIGLAGVLWPSIWWPDDSGADVPGGAASLNVPESSEAVAEPLRQLYAQPTQQALLNDLLTLLDNRPQTLEALNTFRDKLAQLTRQTTQTTQQDTVGLHVPDLENADVEALFSALAMDEPAPDSPGGAASMNPFGMLWQGAKAALRVTSYWTMKERAGIVGEVGLGPVLRRLHQTMPTLRIHLIGHSFGTRLVSYALKGMGTAFTGGASPIKQVFMLQGAFSHYAYAPSLPFDPARSGDLAGMERRVDGVIAATYSVHDLAVAQAYRLASLLAGQDASAVGDLTDRWQGMGFDGAQGVGASDERLGSPGTAYVPGGSPFINLDSNHLIRNGGLPNGAHSDILHPETAWVPLALAGLR